MERSSGLVEETDPAVLAQLPPGPVYRCLDCGTIVRHGQPHTASEPWPHQTIAALWRCA